MDRNTVAYQKPNTGLWSRVGWRVTDGGDRERGAHRYTAGTPWTTNDLTSPKTKKDES